MSALQVIIIVAGAWIPLAIYGKFSKQLTASGLNWCKVGLDLAACFIASATVFGVMTFALTISSDNFGDIALIAKITIFAGFAFTGVAFLKFLLAWVIAKASCRVRKHLS